MSGQPRRPAPGTRRRGDTEGAAHAGGDRAPAAGVLTRGTVVIDRERCKGCELCIPACRPGVLEMSAEVNAIGYRYPVLLPGCTGCRACHAVCPDYVFEVFKYDEPIVLPVAGADDDTDTDTDADEPGAEPGAGPTDAGTDDAPATAGGRPTGQHEDGGGAS